MKKFDEVEASVGHRLLAPRIAYMIGTTGSRGPNLIPVSNLTSVSRSPQLLVISIYKEWDTYHNLINAKGFTVSVPTTDHIDAVWKLATKYSGFTPPEGQNKFDVCGATIDMVASEFGPIFGDAIGWLECRIIKEAEIESDHGIFFGEVTKAFFDPDFLTPQGRYKQNSRPVMQVVKNSFSTSADHWEIPYFNK